MINLPSPARSCIDPKRTHKQKPISPILLATLLASLSNILPAVDEHGLTSKPETTTAIRADLDRIVEIRDLALRDLQKRRKHEDAAEPAINMKLLLNGAVRIPTLSGSFGAAAIADGVPDEGGFRPGQVADGWTSKEVELVVPRRGGAWADGWATVRKLDQRRHLVDASGLALSGQRITGTLRLVVSMDPHGLLGRAHSSLPRRVFVEEYERGWRTDSLMPLPRIAHLQVDLTKDTSSDAVIRGRFQGEDEFGVYEGTVSGQVCRIEHLPAFPAASVSSSEKIPELAQAAVRAYEQLRLLDVYGRYGLPDLAEAERLVFTSSRLWSDVNTAATADAVHRLRLWAENWQQEPVASVPTWPIVKTQIPEDSVAAMASAEDGAWIYPSDAVRAGKWSEVPQWSIAGPFPWNEGWAYPTPRLPDLSPEHGAGYLPDRNRLMAYYRPSAEETIGWNMLTNVLGSTRPPLWGNAVGEGYPTAGLRGSRWFAAARVRCDRATSVLLALEADYRCTLWINGRLVCLGDGDGFACTRDTYQEGLRGPRPRHLCKVQLQSGENEFLLSCENLAGDTRFSLRFGSDPEPDAPLPEPLPLGGAQVALQMVRRMGLGESTVFEKVMNIAPVVVGRNDQCQWATPSAMLPPTLRQVGPIPVSDTATVGRIRQSLLERPGESPVRPGESVPDVVLDPRLFDPQRGVEYPFGRLALMNFLSVVMHNEFPRVVMPSVKTRDGLLVRMWIAGREVPPGTGVRLDRGDYPLLVEIRKMEESDQEPPMVSTRVVIRLGPNHDPMELNVQRLKYLRACRLRCEWAGTMLASRVEVRPVKEIFDRVTTAEQAVIAELDGHVASPAEAPRPIYRIEKSARGEGSDVAWSCVMMARHPLYHADEKSFMVDVWIPPTVPVARAALLFMSGEPFSLPDWRKAAQDLGMAMVLVGGSYAERKQLHFAFRDGDWLVHQALLRAGADLVRPELANLPWVPWGLSGWGSAGALLRNRRPEALLGCLPYHGCDSLREDPFAECTPEAMSVPVVFSVGSNDLGGHQDGMVARLLRGRPKGELLAYLREPGAAHVGTGPLSFQAAWIAAVMKKRLPLDWDPRQGPPKMRTIAESDGWLGDPMTGEIASWADFTTDRARASWLPDETAAIEWQKVTRPIPRPRKK